ncbi:MAG: InlB B-repeat-containing protein [Clostridia bacterium]|nr:InlB B-repeat-containing protein [Clostridia bacterium]
MKTKRLLLATLLTVLCVCAGIFAAACSGALYTVTFDVQGHGSAPQAVTGLAEGDKVQKPDDPTADGYVFLGWYKDAQLGEEWDFDKDTVSSDITLYASWGHNVTFDVQGRGNAPQSEVVAVGGKPKKPDDPITDGYVFGGWYKEAACENRWDFFADSVKSNTVLYAKWKEIYAVTADGFSVEVKDSEYFNVEHAGSYIVSISKPEDGNGFDFRLDDETQIADFTYSDYWSQNYFLEEGMHRISAVVKQFNARVSLSGLSMPFVDVEEYEGETYKLNVSEAGDVPAVRFGSSTVDVAWAVEFDGECYTLRVRETYNGLYDYYNIKIKINFNGSKVASIDVYTREGGEWSKTPADTLEKARTAVEIKKDLNASDAGEMNSASLERGFGYVYFDLGAYKNQWLEFSGFAAGTEFYFCNIGVGAKGQIEDRIAIADGEPIRLSDNERYGYLNFIAVKPASGTVVSFTVKTVEEPAPAPGSSEDNPITLTVGEEYSSESKSNEVYYFVFNTEEEGKYKISVYWDYDGNKIKVAKCVLDGFNDPHLFPPTPEKFLDGYEKEFEAGSEHTLAVTAAANNIIVKVEKVEEAVAGGLQSGSYKGDAVSSSFKYEITIEIDAAAKTAVISNTRFRGTINLGTETSEETQLTDNGNGSYGFSAVVGSNFFNITMTPSADGSSLSVTGTYTFTAELQA